MDENSNRIKFNHFDVRKMIKNKQTKILENLEL